MPRPVLWNLLALTAVAAPLTAHAQPRLFLSRAAAPLGESADICVSMSGGGGQLAGLQLNLNWEDSCMTPTDARRLCRSDPATGKVVQSALQGRGSLKAILISFSDVNPIPDGNLFCCSFEAVGNIGRCNPVQMSNIIGSTSSGQRIDNIGAGNVGEFTVLAERGAPGDAVAGGNVPRGAVPDSPPAAVFEPPGVVAPAPAPVEPGQNAPPREAAAGRAGPAVPGVGKPPVELGAQAPPSGAEVVDAIITGQVPTDLPAVVEPRVVEPEALAAIDAPVVATETRTPEPSTATPAAAAKATPTAVPDTPTPLPPTSTPTPESGWLGGCEMRIPPG